MLPSCTLFLNSCPIAHTLLGVQMKRHKMFKKWPYHLQQAIIHERLLPSVNINNIKPWSKIYWCAAGGPSADEDYWWSDHLQAEYISANCLICWWNQCQRPVQRPLWAGTLLATSCGKQSHPPVGLSCMVTLHAYDYQVYLWYCEWHTPIQCVSCVYSCRLHTVCGRVQSSSVFQRRQIVWGSWRREETMRGRTQQSPRSSGKSRPRSGEHCCLDSQATVQRRGWGTTGSVPQWVYCG